MTLTPQEQREAQRNVKSRTRAIELMCKQCIHDPHDSRTWRQQVEQCGAFECPLFMWRPCVGGEARKVLPRTQSPSKPQLKLE